MTDVAVLFARADSVYKTLPGCDVWDIERDARKWPGGAPVVAHPPCRAWGRLRHFAKPRPDEKPLAVAAVANVRAFGGVLEHPACSSLWPHCGLPRPGAGADEHGGWTLEVRQCDWGHPAEKLTWLYIVGVTAASLPPMPPRQEPTGLVKPRRGVPRDGRKIITKAARERTPPEFAAWLVEVARRARRSDAISTRARQLAAGLRGDQLVPGQRVATTLERLADTHDQLLALVREMQQQAGSAQG